MTSTGRRNRVARWVLLALAGLAVLGNLAFFLVVDRLTGEPLLSAAAGQSQGVVLATPVDPDGGRRAGGPHPAR
jgi:hypothetical protein